MASQDSTKVGCNNFFTLRVKNMTFYLTSIAVVTSYVVFETEVELARARES